MLFSIINKLSALSGISLITGLLMAASHAQAKPLTTIQGLSPVQEITFMGGIDPADRKPEGRNYYRRLKGKKR